MALLPVLAILVLSGISAWPVYVTGSNAYRPIMKVSDDTGHDWLNEHSDRADRVTWVFYVMAGIAAITIVAALKWLKSAFPLGIPSLFFALGGLGADGYIAQAGGMIRHVECRVPGLFPPAVIESMLNHHP